jgi:predicted DNA-binding transcriptional regulator AlpA
VTGRFLNARELAGQLGVSAGALLRWTRAGQVPAVKLPSGVIRYIPEQIDAWLIERAMADDATEEVSPAPNAVRRMEVSSVASPVPLRTSNSMKGPARRWRSPSASVVKLGRDVDAGEAVGGSGRVVGADRAVVAGEAATLPLSRSQAA